MKTVDIEQWGSDIYRRSGCKSVGVGANDLCRAQITLTDFNKGFVSARVNDGNIPFRTLFKPYTGALFRYTA